MSRVVGIDLGTTNSCVAVLEGDQPTVIPNSEGGRTTPSIVAITKNGERLVGEAARRQMTVNVDRTITSIKRAMGTTYRKRIDGKDYSPQEISAIILAKLKSDAESYLGGPVSDAVITVPAYFDDSQRQATKDAGRIAGLNVLRIINEPTSAALAYGLDNGQAQKILVYDLGGGTFDVSVIEIGDSVIEVLATAGDNHLGGDDFDERLLDHVIKTFKKETKVNLAKDITASQRVREACENAKKELSFAQTAHINLPFISTVKNQPVHLDMTITREQFNELTYDLVERTAGPVNQALSDAGITRNQIDKVLLVLCCIYLVRTGVVSKWAMLGLTAAGAAALALFGMDAVKSLYEFRLSGSGHLISGDEDRWKLLAAGVQDFLLHPLFGTGLGNTAHSALAVIVPGSMAFYHNLVAQVIGSMGIVGIFAYGVLIRDRFSLLLRGRKDPFVGAMLLSYLAMLMVSMTNPGEFCPFPNAALMVMVFSMVEEAVGAETVTVTQLRRRGALRGSTGGSYAQYK